MSNPNDFDMHAELQALAQKREDKETGPEAQKRAKYDDFSVEAEVQKLRRNRLTAEIEADKAKAAAAKAEGKDWSEATPEEFDKYLASLGVYRHF